MAPSTSSFFKEDYLVNDSKMRRVKQARDRRRDASPPFASIALKRLELKGGACQGFSLSLLRVA